METSYHPISYISTMRSGDMRSDVFCRCMWCFEWSHSGSRNRGWVYEKGIFLQVFVSKKILHNSVQRILDIFFYFYQTSSILLWVVNGYVSSLAITPSWSHGYSTIMSGFWACTRSQNSNTDIGRAHISWISRTHLRIHSVRSQIITAWSM